MRVLITVTSIMLLAACAVLNYTPSIKSVGKPNGHRITKDLQECKQLAKHAAISAADGAGSQVYSMEERFKSAYDNCMSGRGHSVIR